MQHWKERIQRITPLAISGRVARVVGQTVSVIGFRVPLGAVCVIQGESGQDIEAEVIGFQRDETVLVPYGALAGVRPGQPVMLRDSVPVARVGEHLLGRVVNSCGEFTDGQPAPHLPHRVTITGQGIAPLSRPRIDSPMTTGVRVIDGLLTCGRGQRLGIFAGSGVGKSTLIGQMVRGSSADVNVVVLVGERGREVREFIERDLGTEGLRRSVVVVATSDEPAMARIRAANLGTAIAEYFRDRSQDVLLLMDSVTRFALAQRELGLSAGEPPTTRGYPPSVFTVLPRLLERSGRAAKGSITAFYTVLMEGDDVNEPIADAVRGILDGHIMLNRQLAEQQWFPAIDVTRSVSRASRDVTDHEQQRAAEKIKALLTAYRQTEDLISIGAYQHGSDHMVDLAIESRERILEFLQQPPQECQDWHTTQYRLKQLIDSLDDKRKLQVESDEAA